MKRATHTTRMAGLLGAYGAAVSLMVGCASDTRESMLGGNRPLVGETAVEAAPAGDAGGLGFFDALEAKPLASQDDAIHSMLLLGTGVSGGSYEQRVAMAKKLGYLNNGFDQPARQAVTMGEVASMATRLLEGKPTATQDEAMERLVRRDITPATARANQGMTGAQLVSVAGGVRDAMSSENVQRVAAPKVWEIMAAVEHPEPAPVAAAPVIESNPKAAASTPVVTPEPAAPRVALNEVEQPEHHRPMAVVATIPAAPAAAATAENGTALKPMSSGMEASNIPPALRGKGRAEPLPKVPVGTAPPAIELQDPNSKPSVITPDEKVYTPGQPKASGTKVNTARPAPKTEQKKDAPKSEGDADWTSGKPVK